MSEYTIILSSKARKSLDQLSDYVVQPLLTAIANLEENPKPFGYKKLSNRDGYRIRVGNYRIIYQVFNTDLIIDVVAIGHRKDIYK